MKFKVRETLERDYQRIYSLLGESHLRDDYFNEENFKRMLARNPHLCYVAVCETTPIGTIFGTHDGAFRGYIQKLAVFEGMRRLGVGSALVERVLEQFDAENIPLIFAHVEKDNGASLALFNSLGFKIRESHCLIDRGYKKRG